MLMNDLMGTATHVHLTPVARTSRSSCNAPRRRDYHSHRPMDQASRVVLNTKCNKSGPTRCDWGGAKTQLSNQHLPLSHGNIQLQRAGRS